MIFGRIFSMALQFHKTSEKNGSKFVKIPLRSSVLVNIENDDKYCFHWSELAHLHPCYNNHLNRVSN